jgi:FKBP-type peptidyl-prolyl cis-trans isomerase SlyD
LAKSRLTALFADISFVAGGQRRDFARLPKRGNSNMVIGQDSVVILHYTLKGDDGKVIDQSSPDEPLAYLHGHGNIVPGLERELTGRNTGDKLAVKVAPADGYGEYEQALVQQVPRRSLQGVQNLKVGMQLQAQTPQGVRIFTVKRLVSDMVTLDGNHELAGQTLHFDVEIADVRAATEEELSHGHVHGAGGHHH